jgi:hypothetical protein
VGAAAIVREALLLGEAGLSFQWQDTELAFVRLYKRGHFLFCFSVRAGANDTGCSIKQEENWKERGLGRINNQFNSHQTVGRREWNAG